MSKAKLTDRFIRTLKTTKTQQDFWDEGVTGGSFGIRVTKQGRKSFVMLYRARGRLRRLTLGTYPNLSLSGARRQARQILGEVASGSDPADDQCMERTFQELADLYLERHAKVRKRPSSIKEDIRILNTYILPLWAERRMDEIQKGDIIALLDTIAFERKAPIMANRVRALVHTIFSFSIRKGLTPEDFVNPCRNVENPGQEISRERTLSEEEIRVLWNELGGRREPTASIYRLLLLTGQRSGEVKATRWDQIDEDGLWNIPAENTKNGREHKVPLSSQARSVIERIKRITGGSEYVFPSGTGHIRWLQKMTKRIQESVGFHFTPHDLRRTAATGMSKLGVDDLIIAKILNHTWADKQVTSIYNRWKKLPEMRAALQSWGDEVERIAGGP